MLGQTARFERFISRMMFILASGQHIDPDKTEDFSGQVEAAYKNPFEVMQTKRQPKTTEEIKQYILCRLEGEEWI